MMRRILITGANSYLGTSLEAYLKQWPDDYAVDTVDMIGDSWQNKDFGGYHTVYHVAGIAHSDFGEIAEDKKELYRRVNTDLAVETAKKAKADGVKQFIFMSTIVVYGKSAGIGKQKVITRDTMPQPDNIYGLSKLEAEAGLKALEDENFHLCILRPPMIYGRGCKGNYARMSQWAKKLPVFPDISNQRSMLYLETLCEMIRQLVDREESGVFFPQNGEYVCTSDMFAAIARANGRRVRLTRIFNPAVRLLAGKMPVIDKVFGSIVYDQQLSRCVFEYRTVGFWESIRRSEGSE